MDKKKKLKICKGGSCTQRLSSYIKDRAENDREFFQIEDKIDITECGCQGNCAAGPTVIFEDGDTTHKFSYMSPTEVSKLLKRVQRNEPIHPQQKKHNPHKK